MVMLILTGSAVALHGPVGWRERRNRVSGLALCGALIAITVTGYCLYYLGDEGARMAASLSHWILGLALPVVLALHALLGRRDRDAEAV
jgi:hypothetical protein